MEALRDTFPRAVSDLGGTPDLLLHKEHITPSILQESNAVISYRAVISLLERASDELNCPDFGLKLAGYSGDGITVLGPLEIAMRNSKTLADAYDYCAKNLQVYSPAVHISVGRDFGEGQSSIVFDILLDGVPRQRQTVEHALGLTHLGVKSLSRDKVQPQEVWFSHSPLAPLNVYRLFFGVPVKFGMPANALLFGKDDLQKPIANRNPQIYEMACSFIDTKFPSPSVLLATQVRIILGRLLATGRCTQINVADMLAMHPRTFQRRLKEEGTSFEELVDATRREIALRNLTDTSVSLTRIAEKLGYSETSVLTRSCYRWFSSSPRQLRKGGT
ncbi:AraC family transcriptional regulator [Noviherbaspirillum sedimenti]|uniref:AraC family transcriptional regulator n=1 Tax=Noviherbaspirillum sedimenti TaxID=2320865 RepID=UPI003B75BEDA